MYTYFKSLFAGLFNIKILIRNPVSVVFHPISEKMTKGIDISHWNTITDWSLAKADIDFVYMKCTEGTKYVDPTCLKNATTAKGLGIKVGYYHFAQTIDSASEEALFFSNTLSKMPKSDLLPVLDIEINKANLTGSQIEAWIRTFIDTMDKLGYGIMLYSYQPFFDQYLPTTHGFGQIPLWLAQYRDVQNPFLPKGWAQAALWQHSSKGSIAGIQGNVDMNKVLNETFVL